MTSKRRTHKIRPCNIRFDLAMKPQRMLVNVRVAEDVDIELSLRMAFMLVVDVGADFTRDVMCMARTYMILCAVKTYRKMNARTKLMVSCSIGGNGSASTGTATTQREGINARYASNKAVAITRFDVVRAVDVHVVK